MTSRAALTGSDSDRGGGEDRVRRVRPRRGLRRGSACGTWSGGGRPAVNAPSITGVPAVGRSPAHVTVTVLIAVTRLKHSSIAAVVPETLEFMRHGM